MKNKISRWFAGLLALVLLALTSPTAQAAYEIVAVDSNGDVTFTPGAIVTPVIGVIAAGAGVVAGGVLLVKGAKWVFRLLGWIR